MRLVLNNFRDIKLIQGTRLRINSKDLTERERVGE